MADIKIVKGTKTITTQVETAHLQYTPEDIKELIQKDAIEKGYVPGEVSFSTDYKYTSDEWGMNTSAVSYFKGAKVKI